jgi:hypothetical protein
MSPKKIETKEQTIQAPPPEEIYRDELAWRRASIASW